MIKIELNFDDLAAKFKSMQDELGLLLAATMQTNRSMMFDKDGADNGKPAWEPLKFREGRPLQDKGVLRKSLAPVTTENGTRPGNSSDGILRIAGTHVTIGTKLMYAGMMNDGTTKMPGGIMKPTKAQALRFPAGKLAGAKGVKDGFMFRKSVKIPARKMDTVTEADKQEWADTMANFIASTLNE